MKQKCFNVFQPQTPLDVIGTSINYAATRKLKGSETLDLVESVIYCATVDQQSQVLEVSLIWYPSGFLCCNIITTLIPNDILHRFRVY